MAARMLRFGMTSYLVSGSEWLQKVLMRVAFMGIGLHLKNTRLRHRLVMQRVLRCQNQIR